MTKGRWEGRGVTAEKLRVGSEAMRVMIQEGILGVEGML